MQQRSKRYKAVLTAQFYGTPQLVFLLHFFLLPQPAQLGATSLPPTTALCSLLTYMT